MVTTGATALPSSVGFRVLGAGSTDNRISVSNGDVNGDGIDDIIVGGRGTDPPLGGHLVCDLCS